MRFAVASHPADGDVVSRREIVGVGDLDVVRARGAFAGQRDLEIHRGLARQDEVRAVAHAVAPGEAQESFVGPRAANDDTRGVRGEDAVHAIEAFGEEDDRSAHRRGVVEGLLRRARGVDLSERIGAVLGDDGEHRRRGGSLRFGLAVVIARIREVVEEAALGGAEGGRPGPGVKGAAPRARAPAARARGGAANAGPAGARLRRAGHRRGLSAGEQGNHGKERAWGKRERAHWIENIPWILVNCAGSWRPAASRAPQVRRDGRGDLENRA